MTDDAQKPSKRIGRPLKNPALGKRSNVMFRLSESRKEMLMEAAASEGRSMSEEIERRIEESFALGDAKVMLDKSEVAKDLAWLLDEEKIRQQIGELAYLLYRVHEHSDRIYGEDMKWFQNEKIHYIATTFGEEASRLIRSIGSVAMLEDARLHPVEDQKPDEPADGGGDA